MKEQIKRELMNLQTLTIQTERKDESTFTREQKVVEFEKDLDAKVEDVYSIFMQRIEAFNKSFI